MGALTKNDPSKTDSQEALELHSRASSDIACIHGNSSPPSQHSQETPELYTRVSSGIAMHLIHRLKYFGLPTHNSCFRFCSIAAITSLSVSTTKKRWAVASLFPALEQPSIIGSGIWREAFCKLIASLPLMVNTHVLAQLIVVLHLVQLQNRCAVAFRWHPRAFPLLVLRNVINHGLLGWQADGST